MRKNAHLALEVGEKVQARCFPASVRSWGQTQQRDLACHGAEVQYPCYLFCTLRNEQLVAKMACKCLQNIAFHSFHAVFETFRLMDLASMHFHMQKKDIVSIFHASAHGPMLQVVTTFNAAVSAMRTYCTLRLGCFEVDRLVLYPFC